MKKSWLEEARRRVRRWVIRPTFHMHYHYGHGDWGDEVWISDFQGSGDISCSRDFLGVLLREIARGGSLYEGWAAYRQDRRVLLAAMAYLDEHSKGVMR